MSNVPEAEARKSITATFESCTYNPAQRQSIIDVLTEELKGWTEGNSKWFAICEMRWLRDHAICLKCYEAADSSAYPQPDEKPIDHFQRVVDGRALLSAYRFKEKAVNGPNITYVNEGNEECILMIDARKLYVSSGCKPFPKGVYGLFDAFQILVKDFSGDHVNTYQLILDQGYGGGRFKLSKDGVFSQMVDSKKQFIAKKLCSYLAVTALTRDSNGRNWGRKIELIDQDNQHKFLVIPESMLAGNELLPTLMDLGLTVLDPGLAQTRASIAAYLASIQPTMRARSVDRVGWHDGTYVLHDKTIGIGEEEVLFQTVSSEQRNASQKGTAEEWRENIGRLCIGNSRLLLAVSSAFAAPLIHIMGSESIGIHFRGKSTEGKTTLLRVGYSPFHGPEKLPSWRATVNALEGIAKAHCDGLLVLDELGMIQPGQAGEAAYMLQNGVGKTRANKLGDPRKSAEWRMIYLSSGEISLAAHLNDGGKQIKAGQEVRLVEVPADAGAGMGAFENIHGAESPAAFAQYLNHSALQSYGEPALAFLGNLVQDQSMAREKALGYSKQFLDGLDLADASGQVQRVARMFALVAAAGELATEYEITGWEPGQAMAGISTCLHAWIDDRGGTNQSEETRMLEQVEGFISQNDQRFSTGALKRAGWIITGADDESAESDTLSRLYCVFPEVFRTEICKGFDPKQVARSLLARGILIAGSKGEPTSNRRHPLTRKQSRCYVIDAVKLLGAGIEEPESLEDLRVIA